MKPVIIIAIIVISASAAGVGVLGYNQYTTDIEDLENQLRKEKDDAEAAAMKASQEKKDAEKELFDLNIQKLAEQKKASEKLKQEQLEFDRQEQLLQEQIRQEQLEAEREQDRLIEQNQINELKAEYRKIAVDSPLIKGIINGGKLSFWIEPLPANISQNVRTTVEKFASMMDGESINDIKLKRTYSENSADFTFNWATDYSPKHIGRQIGDHLLVGLGSSNCGSWKPFNDGSLLLIMIHEMGHALGQGHSNNSNNIMYYQIDTQYEYDYKETITLRDGYRHQIPFCNSGDVFFTTEKAYDSSAGYELYVIPPSTDASDFVFRSEGKYYPDCSGDSGQTYNSISKSCNNLPSGAKLVLYNPSNFGTGNDAIIKIEIRETNDFKNIEGNFESSSRYWSQDELDAIRDLFEN